MRILITNAFHFFLDHKIAMDFTAAVLFVCLFVFIKPETLYFAPCVWREIITPGNDRTRTQAQTTCVRQRQRHRPRTCQSMANTLQVDGLARFVCLFVCWYKPRKIILRLFCLEGSKPPGNDRTRTQALLRA